MAFFRCPFFSVSVDECDGDIGCGVARPHTFVHGECVDIWFDGGSDLSFTDGDHIVLEISEVGSSDIGFDMSRVWVHGHESAPEEVFLVSDAVEWCECGVDDALVGEDLHFLRCVEGVEDFLFGVSCFFHESVSFCLFDTSVHDVVDFCLFKVSGEGCCFAFLFFVEESLLEVLHVLCDGVFGVFLHTGVDGGIDTESVVVDIIWCSVGFAVFLAESVEGIVLPLFEVDIVLLLVPL